MTTTRPSRQWLLILLAIAALGLGVRGIALATAAQCGQPDREDLAAALRGETPADGRCVVLTDAPVYREQAVENADGHWFQTAELTEAGLRQPSALHPPLYASYLTVFTLVGIDSFDALRALTVPLGAITIALSGLVARRIGGDRVGLLAAGLVAVHPMVWINDVVLMSESLFMVTVPLVTWAALVAWERRDLRSAAVLGAAIGASALVRSEAILLVAITGLPVCVGWARRWQVEAWKRVGAVGLAAGLVVAPWVGANLLRFHEPTLFTTTAGFSTAFANCPAVYETGPELGTRSPACLQDATTYLDLGPNPDQSDADAALLRLARRQVRDDPQGATLASAARVGRMWGLYAPFDSIERDEPLERRGIGRSQLAIAVGWYVMAAGAWGALLVRRRGGVPLSPLLGWVVTSTIVAAVNLGLHRFRASSDVALCILAAVAVDQLVRIWRREPTAGPVPATTPQRT